jgi:hypothetical protein
MHVARITLTIPTRFREPPDVRASQKSGEHGQGLLQMRGEPADLVSHVRDAMDIHRGKHQRVENGVHLSDERNPNAASVIARRDIAASVEALFHRQMVLNQQEEMMNQTRLQRSGRRLPPCYVSPALYAGMVSYSSGGTMTQRQQKPIPWVRF